jgi:hypothetical protein
MKAKAFNTTVLFYPNKNPRLRLFALWYFTTLMVIWNLVGHTRLGFEQSWATPLAAIATAIGVSMLLDWIDARALNREVRFTGSVGNFLNFLPACLIPGFACGMLFHANERLAGDSRRSFHGFKSHFARPGGNGHTQYIFNPSNFGAPQRPVSRSPAPTIARRISPARDQCSDDCPYHRSSSMAVHGRLPLVRLVAGSCCKASFAPIFPVHLIVP